MALVGTAFVNFEGDFSNMARDASRAGGRAGAQYGSQFSRDANKGTKRGLGSFGKDGERAGKDAGKRAGAGFLGSFKGVFAGAAVLGGIELFGDFVSEARESEKVGRITANAIKVTGGAANISAGQVAKLAEAISNKTGIDDEQIQTASNMLLTFKNIRNEAGKNNDIFNRSAKAATDLSVQFGGIDGASKQLGKALQDPVKGVSALGRAGVTFSQTQKDQIANFVKTGDLLSAQKIILGEVEGQVGGAAAAAADPMQKLGVIVANLKERIGTALLPVVERIATFLGDNLPGALDFAGRAFDGIMGVVGPLADGFGSLVSALTPAFSAIVNFVRSNPAPVFAGLAAIVLPFFAGWAISAGLAAVSTLLAVAPIIAVAAAIALLAGGLVYAYQNFQGFHNVVDTVFAALKTAATFVINLVVDLFRNYLIPAAQAVGAFFMNTLWPAIQVAWDGILSAIQVAWGVIKTVFAAVSWFVTTILIPIFNTFMGVAKFVFSIIVAVIKDAWEIVAPVFAAIVGFVRDQLISRFNTFMGVAKVVFSAVHGAVSTAWNIIAPVFRAIVAFVKDKLIPVWDGISGAVSSAFSKIPKIIGAALRTAGNVIAEFMRGAAGIAGTIGLDNIAGALRGGAGSADKWGEGFARGGSLPPFVTNGPRAIVGEGNRRFPEFVIPTDPKYRGRAQGLWQQAGTQLLAKGGIVGGIGDLAGKGVDLVKGVGGGLLDKLREVASGALERIWPTLPVPGNLLGLVPGGHNYMREGIIGFIKGEAKKREAAEQAKESRPSGGLAASTTGINDAFLRRFNEWNAATGGKYRIGSGFRSYASQAALYAKYLNGTGNLAARPGRSNHERGLAIDTSPRVSGADQALARSFRLHFPVRGEPWHVEPFARGGVLPVSHHARSFDSGGVLEKGLNLVNNSTGAKEPLVAAGQRAGVQFGNVYLRNEVDIDLLERKMSFAQLARG